MKETPGYHFWLQRNARRKNGADAEQSSYNVGGREIGHVLACISRSRRPRSMIRVPFDYIFDALQESGLSFEIAPELGKIVFFSRWAGDAQSDRLMG